MPDGQPYRHRRARPSPPRPSSILGPADPRLQHPDLHIVDAHRGLCNVLQPQPSFRLALHQCLHVHSPFLVVPPSSKPARRQRARSDSKPPTPIEPRRVEYPWNQVFPKSVVLPKMQTQPAAVPPRRLKLRSTAVLLLAPLLASAAVSFGQTSAPVDATALVRRAVQHRLDEIGRASCRERV